MLRTLLSSQFLVAVRAFAHASPRLTLCLAVVATALGLLQPAFVIATGFLVQAVASGAPVVVPLTLLGVIFAVTRVLGPLRDELGQALWRRVDQSMGDRIMRAVSEQPGLQVVEDPRVQDLVAQAEGAVTGYSVGQAAQMLPMMWSQRVFSVVSLLIVARTYWWAAALLAIVHILGYQGARWHWNQVTTVILHRTDRMRRTFYQAGWR
jgi:ATP-binding cassette subfamily B protein